MCVTQVCNSELSSYFYSCSKNSLFHVDLKYFFLVENCNVIVLRILLCPIVIDSILDF